MLLPRGRHSLHKDPGHAPARRRHANDAVRLTASYLDRRGAHPGSVAPPRPRLKTYTAATLLPSCEVPVADAATGRGWGGSRLPAMAFLAASASPSMPAGGAGLASPRPKLDGVSSTDRGWTVFHLPSTHDGCEPFDSKLIAEIKQGDPSTNRTWSAHQMPSAPPASSPPSGELRSRTRLCSVLGAVILPL